MRHLLLQNQPLRQNTQPLEKSTDSKGVVTYEMEAAKGKEKLGLSFDANGKLLSKAPIKKEGK